MPFTRRAPRTTGLSAFLRLWYEFVLRYPGLRTPQVPPVVHVQVDFSTVCCCGLTTASWSHGPYDLSCGARRLAHRLLEVCIQKYVRCLNSPHTFHVRDIGGMRNFPSPDILEFKFCLVGLHIGTRKSSSAVAVRPHIAVYALRSAISNSWQVAYDTSKTGVLQSWLHRVRYDNHKTNIGRCRSECNTVSGLKFPHLSVPTMGYLLQSSTCCQSHDGRRQVRKV